MQLLLWFIGLFLMSDAQDYSYPQEPDLQSTVDVARDAVDRHINQIKSSKVEPPPMFPFGLTSQLQDLKILEIMGIHLLSIILPRYPLPSKQDKTTDGQEESVTGKIVQTSPYPVVHPSEVTTHDQATDSSRSARNFGLLRGVPGVDFPNYIDIPQTSFTCSDKPYIPGFYADLDTRCQVFHACWPDKRETFLCPMGTIFDQQTLACEYWYGVNCSFAPVYYKVNADSNKFLLENDEEGFVMDDLGYLLEPPVSSNTSDFDYFSQFVPQKAKVFIYPEAEGQLSKVASESEWILQTFPGHKVSDNLGVTNDNLSGKPQISEVLKQADLDLPRSIYRGISYDTLDGILDDIKRDRLIVRFYGVVKEMVERFRLNQSVSVPVKYIPAPNSKLYRYYVSARNNEKSIRFIVKNMLRSLAEYIDESRDNTKNIKPADLKEVSPKILHRRYITNHVSEEYDETKDHEPMPVETESEEMPKDEIKESLRSRSLQANLMNISPKTKKALLGSYTRLLKLKSEEM